MKRNQALVVLSKLCETLKKVDYEVKLVNGETGETVEPDPTAIKAGLIAGVMAAKSIVAVNSMPESGDDYLAVVSEMVGKAAKIYLAEHLSARADGVDNG